MSIQRVEDTFEHTFGGEDLVRLAQSGNFVANHCHNDRSRKIDRVQCLEHLVDRGNVPAGTRFYFVMHISFLRRRTILSMLAADGLPGFLRRRKTLLSAYS